MAITDDIAGIWTEKAQREDFFSGRASLENLTSVLREELARFDTIKQAGSFDTIPQTLKDAMLRWETAFKAVDVILVADAEITEIFDWRP